MVSKGKRAPLTMEWCALSNSAVGTGASQQRGLVSVLKTVAILVIFEAAGSPWNGTKHRVVAVPRETGRDQFEVGRDKRWIQTDDASVQVRIKRKAAGEHAHSVRDIGHSSVSVTLQTRKHVRSAVQNETR